MAPFKEFVKHPIKTARHLWVFSPPSNVFESRRSFLKLGLTGIACLGAISLFSKCTPDITGPASEGYTAVKVDGKVEFIAPIGTSVTADKVTLRVSSITNPDFASEPREATVEILKADATAAYTARMRKGEITGEFYSPQDTAKTSAYKLECTDIPASAPASLAKFMLWKKPA